MHPFFLLLSTAAALRTTCTLPTRTSLLILPTPTALLGNNSQTYDDTSTSLTLPFVVTIANRTSSTINLSVNGLLSFAAPQSSYNNTPLPNHNASAVASFLPVQALAPFWDDLIIIPNFGEGIYYEVSGAVGKRNASIEWFVSLHHNPFTYAHFVVTTMEAKKGVWMMQYVTADGFGGNATVGAQSAHRDVQFSYNEKKVLPGMVLEVDTLGMNVTVVSPGCRTTQQTP